MVKKEKQGETEESSKPEETSSYCPVSSKEGLVDAVLRENQPR
jgi:hypothetical protein